MTSIHFPGLKDALFVDSVSKVMNTQPDLLIIPK